MYYLPPPGLPVYTLQIVTVTKFNTHFDLSPSLIRNFRYEGLAKSKK